MVAAIKVLSFKVLSKDRLMIDIPLSLWEEREAEVD